MKRMRRILMVCLALLLVLSFAACDVLEEEGIIEPAETGLKASGTIEAQDVSAASELGGKVLEVIVAEGDLVKAGDLLFSMESEMLQAQREQTLASISAAEAGQDAMQAGLEAAQANQEYVRLQYELTLLAARLEEQPERITLWKRDFPTEFNLPDWYFEKAEEISAAESEMSTAEAAWQVELENLEALLDDTTYAELEEREIRLSEARAAFLVADEVLERARAQSDTDLKDVAEDSYDAAEAELEAAQKSYDQLMTEQDYENLLESRSRVTVAKERYEIARDIYESKLTGEESIAVQLAEQALEMAEAQTLQAEAGIYQVEKQIEEAEKSLELIDLSIEKLVVKAAVDGVVRTRNIEPGEVLQPGAAALVLDRLDQLTVTVYFPEDRYGQIKLGDKASVSVDSYPGETFEAIVIRISDRAEYTPRNVQTAEDRVTTVYAIELSIDDYDGKLKPGMPLDAVFEK